ncbi:MAG: hypothetical protein QG646_3615, partial [Euryarchaeota archaeon]|nr:hypothetical protein [Euryarchaeota archaeon]
MTPAPLEAGMEAGTRAELEISAAVDVVVPIGVGTA